MVCFLGKEEVIAGLEKKNCSLLHYLFYSLLVRKLLKFSSSSREHMSLLLNCVWKSRSTFLNAVVQNCL